jgi:hypothetical protein
LGWIWSATPTWLGPDNRRQDPLHRHGNGSVHQQKFGDYFNKSTEKWIDVRRIINGLDKAPQIADYAKRFYGAISYTTRP